MPAKWITCGFCYVPWDVLETRSPQPTLVTSLRYGKKRLWGKCVWPKGIEIQWVVVTITMAPSEQISPIPNACRASISSYRQKRKATSIVGIGRTRSWYSTSASVKALTDQLNTDLTDTNLTGCRSTGEIYTLFDKSILTMQSAHKASITRNFPSIDLQFR